MSMTMTLELRSEGHGEVSARCLPCLCKGPEGARGLLSSGDWEQADVSGGHSRGGRQQKAAEGSGHEPVLTL